MKRFISFGSIEQFRTIVKNVQKKAQFVSYNEDTKEAIINKDAEMPKITAIGTEKIHGTNASVCYSDVDGFWVQSRKNIITVEKDNAGCAFSAYANEEAWMSIIRDLSEYYEIDLTKNIISVYFEWAGGNIQKNSALTGLEKRAMIFQYFKVSPIEPQTGEDGQEVSAYWLETRGESIYVDGSPTGVYVYNWLDNPEKGIYNIMKFPRVEVEIDFNRPDIANNKMIEMVDELEEDSLVGEAFGIKGNIGEGYVFSFEYKGDIYRFKVKGEKHSKSKVKTLKPVDSAKEQAKIDFANYACPAWRLEQAWQEVFGLENEKMEPSKKATPDFLRAVIADVWKEETDIAIERGLEPKEVNATISKIARTWFFDELDKMVGL